MADNTGLFGDGMMGGYGNNITAANIIRSRYRQPIAQAAMENAEPNSSIRATPPTKFESWLNESGQRLMNPTDTIAQGVQNFTQQDPVDMGLGLMNGGLGVVKDVALPLRLPRASLSDQFISGEANRVGRQMMGEHVTLPYQTANLADNSLKESQRLKNIQYGLQPTGTRAEPALIEPQIGDINVAVPGDRTISDYNLAHLNNKEINSQQYGGARYALGQQHLNEPEFWKSNVAPATNLQSKILRIQEEFNPTRIMGQHLGMGQTANNFAQHFADANLKNIDLSAMSPIQIESFNNLIRQGSKPTGAFPDFPGIQDKEAAYLAMQKNPELRKFFNDRMKKPSVTVAHNMPNGLDVQYAISEPALRDMETNIVGLGAGQLNPYAKATAGGFTHPTYSTTIPQMPGTKAGSNQVLAPMSITHPDAISYLANTPKTIDELGNPIYRRSADLTGTMQKIFPHQVVDQQYLDNYGQYIHELNKVTGARSPAENFALVNALRSK